MCVTCCKNCQQSCPPHVRLLAHSTGHSVVRLFRGSDGQHTSGCLLVQNMTTAESLTGANSMRLIVHYPEHLGLEEEANSSAGETHSLPCHGRLVLGGV